MAQGAEALAWSVLFGLHRRSRRCSTRFRSSQGGAADTRFALPSAHVFEGMRAAMAGVIAWDHLAWAVGLNAVWLARRDPAVRATISRRPHPRRAHFHRRVIANHDRNPLLA